jgi:hypothetical protein
MAPMVELHEVITAATWILWLVMFCVAAVVLVQVSNYFTGESPQTVLKAVRTTLVVWATVYFVYDVSGYLFALIMQDPSNGIHMPVHYTYWDWFREPFALKWAVLGFVPIIRFLPVIFGLCAGSILHVIILDTTFPIAVAVFLAEVFLDAFALIAISFAFNLGLAAYERDVTRPELVQQREEEIREALSGREAPQSLRHLRHRIDNLPADQGPGSRQVAAGWQSFNAHLDPLYSMLRPITQHLPLPAQDFLDQGGWLLVLPALAGLAIAWPKIHRGRKRLHHRKRKQRSDPDAHLRVQLSEIGESITALGARQLTVQGQPARLRLVVFAPAEATAVMAANTPHEPLLDAVLPGLKQIASGDFPKVLRWIDPRACDGFRSTVVERVRFPDSADESSRWVLLVGDVAMPQGRYHLAAGVRTANPTPARVLEVSSGKWAELFGIRDVPLEDQGL